MVAIIFLIIKFITIFQVIKTVLQQNSVLDLDLQNLENEQAEAKDIKNNNEVKVIILFNLMVILSHIS